MHADSYDVQVKQRVKKVSQTDPQPEDPRNHTFHNTDCSEVRSTDTIIKTVEKKLWFFSPITQLIWSFLNPLDWNEYDFKFEGLPLDPSTPITRFNESLYVREHLDWDKGLLFFTHDGTKIRPFDIVQVNGNEQLYLFVSYYQKDNSAFLALDESGYRTKANYKKFKHGVCRVYVCVME